MVHSAEPADAVSSGVRAMLSATQAAEGFAHLSIRRADDMAQACSCSRREVEIAALQQHIAPERYLRNLGTVGWDGQVKLLQSSVAIVGAGGLGGWVAETLARMGVGQLTLIDGDRFEENNLNRQLGCIEATVGQFKVTVMAERVRQVNQSVEVVSRVAWLAEDVSDELIGGADVVVDALDTIPARFILQRSADRVGIPMVHGAIAGYSGQIMTILPGDPGLAALYGDPEHAPTRGLETDWGNPSATPMMVSAWQAHEVIKLLLGRGEILRGRLLVFDAEYGTVSEIALG